MVGPGMSTCSAASQKYATDIIVGEKRKYKIINGMKKEAYDKSEEGRRGRYYKEEW